MKKKNGKIMRLIPLDISLTKNNTGKSSINCTEKKNIQK